MSWTLLPREDSLLKQRRQGRTKVTQNMVALAANIPSSDSPAQTSTFRLSEIIHSKPSPHSWQGETHWANRPAPCNDKQVPTSAMHWAYSPPLTLPDGEIVIVLIFKTRKLSLRHNEWPKDTQQVKTVRPV